MNLENLAAQYGIGIVILVVLGAVIRKMWDDRGKDREQMASVMRADQESRERTTTAMTEAMTKVSTILTRFVEVDGTNQKDCGIIREALTIEVTRLSTMQELDARLKELEKNLKPPAH